VDAIESTLGGLIGGRLDHTAIDRAHRPARNANDAEAGARDARVYAHDDDHPY
jgi:hypothetical protein